VNERVSGVARTATAVPTTVFSEGIAFDGNGFVRTAVTAPAFSYLRPIESGNESLVGLTRILPNRSPDTPAVLRASLQAWEKLRTIASFVA
jgi:hypothetical protein